MQKTEQADDCLSEAEIRANIDALTPADYFRLGKAARYHSRGGLNPDDIYQEAFALTLERKRKCPRNVDFKIFMANAMRSIAYAQRQKKKRAATHTFSELAQPNDDFIEGQLSTSSDDVLIEKQQQADDEVLHGKVFALFEGDDDATVILMGIADGLTVNEICKLGGMDVTTYESARKRIRRSLNKHFPKDGAND